MTSSRFNFLFATLEAGGTLGPALTVARKLVARGHRVRVMSDRCSQAAAQATGAAFRPWTRAPSRPNRSRDTVPFRDWEAPTPEDALIGMIAKVMTGPALAYAQDLTEELEREPADLVVANEMLFGVAAACEALGQKLALLTANVSLFPVPGIPPMGPGLSPASTLEEQELHAAITAGLGAMLDSQLPALNTARAELGLPPLTAALEQLKAADAILLGTARAFDFAPASLPPRLTYVGPQLDEPDWAEPLPPGLAHDARPLVLVAFSTTYQAHESVLQRVIDALGRLPVRGLVTLAADLPADVLHAPDNVLIVSSAGHDAAMREAALVVTHGGHGTVARALVHRRPMLILPHGRDQNDNAVRVVVRGAGLSLPNTATGEQIQAALARLLDEPEFARAADALGAAVAEEAQRSTVIDALESLAGASTSPTAEGGRVMPNPC